MLNEIIKHIRDRDYMSGVEREKSRVKATGEVFTPTPLVQQILDKLPQEEFTDPTKTFLDPSCGDGQFLGEVVIRKVESLSKMLGAGVDCKVMLEIALETTYGVDIMQDNVNLCRERLLCGHEEFRHIVEQNIVRADALEYNYEFENIDELREQLFKYRAD